MTYHGVPKMSLLSQFDDLCRYTQTLTAGCEAEFKTFTQSQLDGYRKRKESECEVRILKERIASIEAEKRKLEVQYKHLIDICEAEVEKRRQVEKEKHCMESQLALIKEVLLADSNNLDNQTKEKLAFLNSCKLNSLPEDKISEFSGGDYAFYFDDPFDETCVKRRSFKKNRLTTISEAARRSAFSVSGDDTTDDFLEKTHPQIRKSNGKRDSVESRESPKRKKSQPAKDDRDENKEMPNVPMKKFGFRSNSEPSGNDPETPVATHVHRSDSDQFKFNSYDLRRLNPGTVSGGTPVGRYSTGGKLSRSHMFVSKTVIRTEKCFPCSRNIGFCNQALKCQDCRLVCHPECKDACPLPCIPTVNTPTKGTTAALSDYVSSTAPKIPALIVHCVNEIEARGLREIGLYRIPGSEREVKDLKEKFFRGRTIPCLNQVDIHAVCGLVKEFLRSLAEPLIPKSAWQTFVEAAEISNEAASLNALNQAVMDLPQANRDTLAFLMLHFQRIDNSKDCKMSNENLAKVLGPTIVGYSASEPTDLIMLSETKYQHKVMLRLLKLNSDCWERMLNVEQDVFQTTMKTPEIIPAPKGTRLGPVYSAQKARRGTLARMPLTPRNEKFSKSTKTHFSSPLLK